MNTKKRYVSQDVLRGLTGDAFAKVMYMDSDIKFLYVVSDLYKTRICI